MSGHLEWRHATDAVFMTLAPEELDSISEDGLPGNEWAVKIVGIDGNGMVVTGTVQELVRFGAALIRELADMAELAAQRRSGVQ